MKHVKRLFSLSALALALAPVTALAQNPDPNAPAPVVGQPPVAGTTTAPVPDQTAPVQPAPTPDAPEPLMWRGTTFTWNQAVSTTTVGVGRDNIGHEEDYYSWDFILSPQLYVYDGEDDKVLIFAEGGVGVEWTDSGTTTLQREPQFRDTQVGVGYNRNIFTSEDNEWATGGALRLRYNIPTSKISLAQGRYGVLSVGGAITQKIRLLGNAADGLNNLTLIGGLTYSRLFARASTPTDPALERTRQSPSGTTLLSDQLSFRSMDIDRLIPSATLILPLYKDLALTTQFRLVSRWKKDFEGTGCDAMVMGECVEADRDPNRATYFTDSTFDISLSQPIYDMFQMNLGYNNETLTLGEDGKTRNPFYSPSAVFYLDLVANIDTIYEKASGRTPVDLPPGPRSNVTTAANEFGMPSF